MHNWAKKIMECLKVKVDGMGLDNIEGADLEELKAWACIAKDIAEYDYYYHITEAMEDDKNEYGEDYDEEGPLRGYRGRSRRTGRYVHRSYTDNMRDMDKAEGKLYYTDSMSMGTSMNNRGYMEPVTMHGYEESSRMNSNKGYEEGYTRGYSEGMTSNMSEYDHAKKGYEESKQKNSGEADKIKQRERLQHLMDTLDKELKPFAPTMDATEKQIVRNGAQKIINSYS